MLWRFWNHLIGFGRAIARWNRLGSHMNNPWEVFASRAPHARSARNCVFLLHKLAPNGRFETWTVMKDYKVSQTNDLVKR